MPEIPEPYGGFLLPTATCNFGNKLFRALFPQTVFDKQKVEVTMTAVSISFGHKANLISFILSILSLGYGTFFTSPIDTEFLIYVFLIGGFFLLFQKNNLFYWITILSMGMVSIYFYWNRISPPKVPVIPFLILAPFVALFIYNLVKKR